MAIDINALKKIVFKVNGDEVTFGLYPQSLVRDKAICSALGTFGQGNWSSFGYFTDGKKEDFMYYLDKVYKGVKYRGIYFTHFRPAFSGDQGSSRKSFQDDNSYYPKNVYWFKYEPIVWQIIKRDNAITLASKFILDAQDYSHFDAKSGIVNDNDDVNSYDRDYQYSFIRQFLNDTFIKTAFTSLESELVSEDYVDNSPNTKGNNGLDFQTPDTLDKVFLMSVADLQKVINTNDVVDKFATDYAMAQGLPVDFAQGSVYKSGFWTRTDSIIFATNGAIVEQLPSALSGVVPCIKIATTYFQQLLYFANTGNLGKSENRFDELCALKQKLASGKPIKLKGSKIVFGSYPCTKVASKKVLEALGSYNQSWKSYLYFDNNNPSDCMFYTDKFYEGHLYRGVYIRSFRTNNTNTPSTNNKASKDGFKVNTTYWFEYVDLTWEVLTRVDGKILLCSSNVLDSQPYSRAYVEKTYKNDEYRTFILRKNDYNCSYIRKWLNEDFYNTAFNSQEKSVILQENFGEFDFELNKDSEHVNQIDVEPIVTPECLKIENIPTETHLDYVGLLPNKLYGEYNSTLKGISQNTTSYAKIQGLLDLSKKKDIGIGENILDGVYWWLSDRGSKDKYVKAVYPWGEVGDVDASSTFVGVVPCLVVRE